MPGQVGRPAKIDHVCVSFLNSISQALALVEAIQGLGSVRHSEGQPRLHLEQVRRVVELAFLGMTASWEEFLEQTLVRYMAGAECDSGYAPALKLGKCRGLKHAYQVLSGDPNYDPTKHFFVWTDPKRVVDVAYVYFDQGEPYSGPIRRFKRELDLAVDIRNRVAHVSQKAKTKFRDAAMYLLQVATLSQGYGVGDLLRAVPEQGFASLRRAPNDADSSVFGSYMRMYQTLATEIAPP